MAEALLQSMSSLSRDGELPKFRQLDERYKCVICDNVLQVPMMTHCGHRMCRQCAMDYVHRGGEDTAKCPVGLEDCLNFSIQTLVPDFGTFKDIQKLQVYCPNNRYGCKDLIPWGKLNEHKDHCLFAVEDCINIGFGCLVKVVKSKRAEHLDNECKFKTKQCPHCEVRVLESQMEEHLQEACPAMSIICPFKCGEQSIQRKEIDEHKKVCQAKPKDCKYKPMGCTYMGSEDEVRRHEADGMATHLDKLFNSMLDLGLENSQLRNKVQELEGGATGGGTVNNTQVMDIKQKCDLIERKQDKQETSLKNTQKMVASMNEKIVTLEEVPTKQDLSLVKESVRTVERKMDLVKQNSSGSLPEESRQQLVSMERTLGICNMRLQEMDLRLQCVETASYNGVLIWKIRDFKRRKQEAVSGRTVSLYSQPFYTSRYGYKACARIYLNGDGMGKTTHMSLFFVILRGDFDALLQWPFRQKVIMTLIDQEGGKKNIIDSFRADPTSNSFKKPTSDMNIASGCPLFAAQSVVESAPFLKDDCIFLKVQVDVNDLKDASYDTKSGSF